MNPIMKHVREFTKIPMSRGAAYGEDNDPWSHKNISQAHSIKIEWTSTLIIYSTIVNMYLHISKYLTIWKCLICIYLIFTSQILNYFLQSTLVVPFYTDTISMPSLSKCSAFGIDMESSDSFTTDSIVCCILHIWPYTRRNMRANTIECRYNAVRYSKILHI